MKKITSFLILAALVLTSNSAWAWRGAKVIVKSEPANGGKVYVSDSNNSSGTYGTSSEKEKTNTWDVSTSTFTFYRFYSVNSNYVFKGWATATTSNSGTTTSSTSVSAGKNALSIPSTTYYAIFARMTADKSAVSFGSINVGQKSDAQTITITHAHAGQITASLSGTNAGDFAISTTTPVSNSVSEGTQAITVTFAPTCNGTRTATLTLKSNNGLSDVNISLSGEGLLNAQTLTWDNEPIDVNMIVGQTLNISATATSGLNVTYASDASDVLSISGNTLTANKVGTATITATQAGDCTYAAATPITKTFTVNALKVPVFWLNDDPDMTETNLFVGGTATIILDNVDASLQQTYDNTQISCAIEGNTLTVTALAAADATLTLSQPATSTIQAASRTFTFHISKNTATLTNNLNDEYKVDDVIALTDVYTNSNSEIEVTVTSTDENVLKVQDGQLVAVGAGTATITVAQAENYKYTPLSAEKTVTVSKYTNSIVVTLDGAAANSKSIYYGDVVAFTYTYGNTAIPATLEQTAGADVATYNSENNTITASYLNGTATWTISQPEDYKYTAAEATVTINVAAAQETCGTLFTKADKIDVGVGSTSDNYTWSIANVAGTLSFEACKSMATAVGDLEIYACKAGNWEKIQTIGVGSLDRDSYKSFSYTLDPQVTGIRFKNAGSYTRHIQNLKVTRLPLYLTTSTSALTLPDNEVGGQTTATFDVSWNTCADLLNIVSSNPKFTVNTATINTDGGIGSATITVTYASDVVEDNATADITLYTTSQVVTVKATASTTKKSQTITWDLAETATTTDVITLSATAQTEVTFTSLNEDVATINADNTLNILQAGTVTLVATAAENEEYKEATLSKTITIELTVPTILTMPTFSDISYGESLAYATLNDGTASVPGMFYILDDIETVYEVGVHDVPVQFIPDNTMLYAMVDMAVSIQVNPAAQTIQWDTVALQKSVKVGDVITLEATATSELAVTYTINDETLATLDLDAETVTAASKGTLTITASQEGNENYLAAEPITVTIQITDSTATGMQSIDSNDVRPQVIKRLVNGQVIIQTPNAKYNINGKKLD